MANDLANVAGRPLVIGTTVATPTQDGKVQLHDSKTNQTATVEMEDFKQFLIANAPKMQQGDTTSFTSKTAEAGGEAADDKNSGAGSVLKVAGSLALVGVAIWKRKEIGEYAKTAVNYLKGKFGKGGKDVEQAVEQTANKSSKVAEDVLTKAKNTEPSVVSVSKKQSVKNTSDYLTTGEKITEEQAYNIVNKVETKHVNANTRKLVNNALVGKEQQAVYNKEVAFQAPTADEAAAIIKNNTKAAKATAKSEQIKNNVDGTTVKALKKVKSNATDPVVGNTRKIVGELPGGKKYVIDLLDGKPTCMLNGEGAFVKDELKMAKFISKWDINLNAPSKL